MWSFKYEPKSLDEMVLNEDIRKYLKNVLDNTQNVTLVGPPGVGKGTFTNILLRTTGYEFMFLNGSDENSVDDMRKKIKSFVRGISDTKYRICVINECDFLSKNAQALLRYEIELVQKKSRFILMCNYGHMIIPELLSRCLPVFITNPPIEDVTKFCMNILNSEKISVKNPKAVVSIIKELYPDIRRIINSLQISVDNGEIRSARIFGNNEIYEAVLASMKRGDPTKIRHILRNNMIDYTELYEFLYNDIFNHEKNWKEHGLAILEIGEAMRSDSLVAIKEINFMKMVIEMLNGKMI